MISSIYICRVLISLHIGNSYVKQNTSFQYTPGIMHRTLPLLRLFDISRLYSYSSGLTTGITSVPEKQPPRICVNKFHASTDTIYITATNKTSGAICIFLWSILHIDGVSRLYTLQQSSLNLAWQQFLSKPPTVIDIWITKWRPQLQTAVTPCDCFAGMSTKSSSSELKSRSA